MHAPDFLTRPLAALRQICTRPLHLLILLLPLAIIATAPVTARDSNGINKHVTQRMTLMTQQRATMEVLTDMMAGRRSFDRSAARNARRQLIRTTASIRKYFKKPALDPRSNARPLIWHRFDDFSKHAANAERAARALNTRSLPALRRSLPDLMHSCLSCHKSYRIPPNTFTTH